ncbi:MAG TPA: hypothetical protein VHT53_06045 [Candidatus Elarobacter sp.]|nr:hypothetical protein [Candidatus Elarobacter sp.]
MTRILLALCIGIVLLDAVESVLSRVTGIPYAWASLIQLVVYLGLGFGLRRLGGHISQAAALGAAVAAVEATAGQAVAVAIGAAPREPVAYMVVVIPFVVLFCMLLVLLGFAVGSIGRRRST